MERASWMSDAGFKSGVKAEESMKASVVVAGAVRGNFRPFVIGVMVVAAVIAFFLGLTYLLGQLASWVLKWPPRDVFDTIPFGAAVLVALILVLGTTISVCAGLAQLLTAVGRSTMDAAQRLKRRRASRQVVDGADKAGGAEAGQMMEHRPILEVRPSEKGTILIVGNAAAFQLLEKEIAARKEGTSYAERALLPTGEAIAICAVCCQADEIAEVTEEHPLVTSALDELFRYYSQVHCTEPEKRFGLVRNGVTI